MNLVQYLLRMRPRLRNWHLVEFTSTAGAHILTRLDRRATGPGRATARSERGAPPVSPFALGRVHQQAETGRPDMRQVPQRRGSPATLRITASGASRLPDSEGLAGRRRNIAGSRQQTCLASTCATSTSGDPCASWRTRGASSPPNRDWIAGPQGLEGPWKGFRSKVRGLEPGKTWRLWGSPPAAASAIMNLWLAIRHPTVP